MNLQTLFKLLKLERGREADEAARIRKLANATDNWLNSQNHVRRL